MFVITLTLGLSLVLLNFTAVLGEWEHSILIFLGLCTTLCFCTQQYVLSSCEEPLPAEAPKNVAIVLSGCLIVASMVTSSLAIINPDTVPSYWLMYLVLVIAVASGFMMAARFHSFAAAPAASPLQPPAVAPEVIGARTSEPGELEEQRPPTTSGAPTGTAEPEPDDVGLGGGALS